MSSSSEPRLPPFTNDIGTVYDRPEKPPIEDESPQHTEVSPISPVNNRTQQLPLNPPQPTYASSLGSRSMSTGSLHGQPPPFNGHQPPYINHALTFPNEGNSSTRKVNFDRFAIPTKNATLSSGFPYDPRVYDLITHDEWHLLSSDIVNAAKLSFTEDFAAWTMGVTTGTLTSAFLVIGGPVVGYYAGRAVHRKTVVKTVKERLDRDGDIRSVLRRWNDQKFTGRGFQVWLELPVDGGEIVVPQEKKPKSVRKAEKKTAKRFRIVIIPNNETVDQTPTYAGPWSPVSPYSSTGGTAQE